MNEIAEIGSILKEFSTVQVSNVNLSYIDRLCPEYKNDPCIVVHKRDNYSQEIQQHTSPPLKDISSSGVFDVTGSPLEYTFNDTFTFDDTISITKRNWQKDDEKYFPLPRVEASTLLNLCLDLYLKKNWRLPIFVLCDGKDVQNTRLLGTKVNEGFFVTIEACCDNCKTFSEVKEDSSNLLKEHMKLSCAQEHEISISTFSTFNLFGTKYEMIDWNPKIEHKDFEGYLSIEVNSHSLSLDPPPRETKYNLVMQIMAGRECSSLNELWKQLVLLNQYLSIIERYKGMVATHRYSTQPLQFPDTFPTPYVQTEEKVVENLRSLLRGNYTYRQFGDNQINKDFKNGVILAAGRTDASIKQYIEDLLFRYNFDFTDLLWEQLIYSKNYVQMIRYINIVTEHIASDGYYPQINQSNRTRFAKLISNLKNDQTISNVLTGSVPLELVADIGFEKLARDYKYILLNTRFVDSSDIQCLISSIASDEFKPNNYKKKLLAMAQIHICLEFMVLVQTCLCCPTESLSSIFECAWKVFLSDTTSVKQFNDLVGNAVFSLTSPVPNRLVDRLKKNNPTLWRTILSSNSEFSKLVTTTCYSRTSIFPLHIYSEDETNKEKDSYHSIKVITSSIKVR